MEDPRWNPAVAEAMHESVKQDTKNNPIKDMNLASEIGNTSWSNYYEQGGYAGEFANDRIPRNMRKYFKEAALACSWVKDKYYFKKGCVDEDYELIEKVDFEANKYQAQKTYKLFKTEFGDYFIIRTSTKPMVMADEITIIAIDVGSANWSGCWRRPKI